MLYHTVRGKKLQRICIILLPLITLTRARINDTLREKKSTTQSEPIQSETSERVEKILNVPITLNFDDEPLTRRSRGFYGGHRRNDENRDERIDDGQFGARILLGIVENANKTKTSLPDQKKSQTIVKYFEKENYDGIKMNPIVIEDHYEDDANQNGKARNRKDIIELEQEQSPIIIKEEDRFQKNADYTEEEREKDYIGGDEYAKELTSNDEYKRTENVELNDHRTEEPYEENEEESNKDEIKEKSAKYIRDDDTGPIQKNEDNNLPSNHEETYTEVENSGKYDHIHQEEMSEKLGKELYLKNENKDNPSSKYVYDRTESARASDVKEHVSQKDQKESTDLSNENVKRKKESEKHASGEGKEEHEGRHGKKSDKGLKEYKGYHEEVKRNKGHHDEKKHGKKYADKGGEEKKHHEEHEHHGDYHKGVKGEKGSEFSEGGKHSKGHSTKGEHNIHKKDEYEKKQEFYDEHHEGGEHEKHGSFHHDDRYEKGGHKKESHHKKGDHEDYYGKKSHHEEGHFNDVKAGKTKGSGHNQQHRHNSKQGKKGDSLGKKHWGYKKGIGGSGHKKYREGQQVAHSSLQQIEQAPPNIHNDYREEGNKYSYLIGEIHPHSDNRRSDTVNNGDGINENLEVNDNEEEIEQKFAQIPNGQMYEDIQPDSKESIGVNNNKQLDDTFSKKKEGSKQDEIEETESRHVTQSPVLYDKNKDSQKNTSEPLPKIYVILPNDFEKQLQRSAESFESSSMEGESVYDDSEEELNRPKIQTIHEKYMKEVKPLEVQSFPEEHEKRLSEIEYIIHQIGSVLEKNKEETEKGSRHSEKF